MTDTTHLGYHELLGHPLFVPLPRWLLVLWSTVVLGLLVWVLAGARRRPAALAALLPAAPIQALAEGVLYPPLAGLEWLPALFGAPLFRGFAVIAAGEALAVLLVGLGFTAALVRLALPRMSDVTPVVHGSARFATRRDLAEADLLSGEGLVLGSVDGGRRPRLLTDRSGQHALIVMPPGAGKTTGPIACSLLNTPDHSALVLDPKGELYELTAGWRLARGHQIVRFAPQDARGRTERWNPLDEVPKGAGEVAAVSALAENLVSYPADSHESHWVASARSLLRCLLLHELYVEKEPSLVTVRNRLATGGGGKGLGRYFKGLAEYVHDEEGREEWAGRNTRTGFTHPEVARLAQGFSATPPRSGGRSCRR